MLEAMLFAAAEPLDETALPVGSRPRGPPSARLCRRGVNLVQIGNKWAFRTANDLAGSCTHQRSRPKKLSRAAIETLAIIAYHQPVTRAEIEEIRGISAAKGTLDVLLETGWIRPRGRRKAPGRPLTYGTTDTSRFSHFGLEALDDLAGLDDLKGSVCSTAICRAGFTVPEPSDDPGSRAGDATDPAAEPGTTVI